MGSLQESGLAPDNLSGVGGDDHFLGCNVRLLAVHHRESFLRRNGPLDHGQSHRPHLEVLRHRCQSTHLAFPGKDNTAHSRQGVLGTVELEEYQPPGRVSKIVHPRDGFLALVASLVQMHRGAQQIELMLRAGADPKQLVDISRNRSAT